MIDLFELYQDFNSAFNTHQFGFFRPVRDFLPAVEEASNEAFNKLAGKMQKSQVITDLLRPFILSANVVVKNNGRYDYAPYPDGYEYYSSARIILQKEKACALPGCNVFEDGKCVDHSKSDLKDFYCNTEFEYEEVPFTPVDNSRWGSVTSHRTKGPTMKKPYGTQLSDGFKILPKGIGVVVIDYYRKPKKAKFVYTERKVGNDESYIEYDANNSEKLEWSEIMKPYFISAMGKRYGLTIQNPLILQQVNNIDKLLA
jgi:hypothetical protein